MFVNRAISVEIHCQLLRCCTARGSITRFSLVGPTKVEACKSFLFTEKFPCIVKKVHWVDFVIMFNKNMLSMVKYISLHSQHIYCSLTVFEILIQINAVLYLLKVNGIIIELTVHTSRYSI